MFHKNTKSVLIIMIVFIMSFVSILLHSDCDMMTMISREGYYLSGNNSTYDLFNFIRVRSNNSLPKKNDDGYGFIYYPSDGSFYYDDQSWFQTDPTSNDNTFYTDDGSAVWDPAWQDSLDEAEDYIMDVNTEATIVLGHARQGSVGEGSHPFYFEYGEKTYTLMHNGTLTSALKTPMYTYLYNLGLLNNSNWGADPEDINEWIDSEIFFLYIMAFINANYGDVVAGIHDALTKESLPDVANSNIRNMLKNPESYFNYSINDYTYKRVANIILSDGVNLYVFRNSPSVGTSHPTHDPYHNLSYEEDNNIITVKTLDDLNTRVDQFDLVKISRDEAPVEFPDFLDFDATNYEIRTLHAGWNWPAFPRLKEQQQYNDDWYQYAVYENGTDLPFLRNTIEDTPTFTGFEEIQGKRESVYPSITYDQQSEVWQDINFGNMLFRHEGYKIKIEDGTINYAYAIDGTRIENYDYTFDDFEEYWLSYYVPYTQNVWNAFGSTIDDLYSVKTEEWAMVRKKPQEGSPWVIAIGQGTEPTISYGDLVVVRTLNEVTDFSWNYLSGGDPFRKEKTEYYSFEEQADYIPVFIEFAPDDIPAEAAVMVEGVCKGASVVCEEDSLTQVCAYILEDAAELLEFEFYYDDRAPVKKISNYSVFNQQTSQNEMRPIYVESQRDYYLVSFKGDGIPIPVEKTISLNHYPNPFYQNAVISYNLPVSSHIKLEIYNIKGQKVKTLIDGLQSNGENSITWNGLDENNNPVSSGIYFSRIESNGQVLNKKMLLMR